MGTDIDCHFNFFDLREENIKYYKSCSIIKGLDLPFYNDGIRRVVVKNLSDGDVVVALYNQGQTTVDIPTTARAAGKSGSDFNLLDVWTGDVSYTSGTISASVKAHDVAVYCLSGGSLLPGFALISASVSACLDLPESSTVNGTNPIIWSCSGAENQRWKMQGNIIQIFDKCLDATSNPVAGTQVQIWGCNKGSTQQWSFQPDGTIKGLSSGLCLDVYGNNTENGTPIILWNCGNVVNRRWVKF